MFLRFIEFLEKDVFVDADLVARNALDLHHITESLVQGDIGDDCLIGILVSSDSMSHEAAISSSGVDGVPGNRIANGCNTSAVHGMSFDWVKC